MDCNNAGRGICGVGKGGEEVMIKDSPQKACANCVHFKYDIPMGELPYCKDGCWGNSDHRHWEEKKMTIRSKWHNFKVKIRRKFAGLVKGGKK